MRSLRMLAVAVATVIAGSGCTAPAAEGGSAGHPHDRDALRVVGPFEVTEYLGLAFVWGALAATVPFRTTSRPVRQAV